MFVLDSLLVGGLKFVLNKLADAADSEQDEEPLLKEDLVALQLRLELGEIEESEFVERERELLARLREIREQREGPREGSWRVAGVEAEFAGDEHVSPAPPEPVAPATRPKKRKRRR
jgi:gas vesicle protein GvpG